MLAAKKMDDEMKILSSQNQKITSKEKEKTNNEISVEEALAASDYYNKKYPELFKALANG